MAKRKKKVKQPKLSSRKAARETISRIGRGAATPGIRVLRSMERKWQSGK